MKSCYSRECVVERGRLSCSGMVEEEASRVSFAMAEALAFGTLALHRGLRPPGADEAAYQPADGLNRGAYSVRSAGNTCIWIAELNSLAAELSRAAAEASQTRFCLSWFRRSLYCRIFTEPGCVFLFLSRDTPVVACPQVRMSGQDSQRGTFNQRHHVLVDQLTGRK